MTMTADRRIEHIHAPEARWERAEPLRERRGTGRERWATPRRSRPTQTPSPTDDHEEKEGKRQLDALA
ncbi:MAG: hypothetical protein ACO2PK_07310 [Armatimonadota bacterium]